jgi:2-iminobutanoate/2-iminopropanoate deaminase
MTSLIEASHGTPGPIAYGNSPAISPPAGHYSHICIGAGIVHVSGQLPLDADGTPLSDQPFERQVKQVLTNLDACLAEAGIDKTRLLQVRVYVTDIALWPKFNEVYGKWIGDLRPARAVAGVSSLHYGVAIEVEATALALSDT